MCVCVCGRERERVGVYVCDTVLSLESLIVFFVLCVCVRVCEREYVCVCVGERERVCVYVCGTALLQLLHLVDFDRFVYIVFVCVRCRSSLSFSIFSTVRVFVRVCV